MGIILIVVPSQQVAAERAQAQAPEPTKTSTTSQSTPASEVALVAESGETLAASSATKPQAAVAQKEAVATTSPSKPIAEAVAAMPEENWLRIKIRSGDNLTTLFKKAGLGANDMYPLLNGIKPSKALNRLKPGEHLEFLIDEGKLAKIRHEHSPLLSTQISKTEDGYTIEQLERTPEVRLTFKEGTIDQSLFLAGANSGLSQSKIMELAYIFGWDVDFALDIRKGDHFRLVYEELLLDGKKIKDGRIVAAEFVNQDRQFHAILHTDKDGNSSYYTPEGKSMRKAFLRTPVDFARISSHFNPNRLHPIFKTSRPHRGVDYAAATGTPIKSAGDGKVIFAGRKGGYGNAVIVQHGERYTTLYAHMNRVKPGIKRGKRVKQGQIIGYVGSTGYATGPHLHYEFRVNGVHRNPVTVPLPHAEPLPKSELASFEPVANEMLALLEAQGRTQLAMNQTDSE